MHRSNVRKILRTLLAAFVIELVVATLVSYFSIWPVAEGNPVEENPSCSQELMALKSSHTVIQATDVLFWKEHPELNGRLIRPGELEYAEAWERHYEQVETCFQTSPQ
ncbi:MAG: hypothetical protein AAFQ74_13110 [Cyanobacteria bacterium J06623_4]